MKARLISWTGLISFLIVIFIFGLAMEFGKKWVAALIAILIIAIVYGAIGLWLWLVRVCKG